MSPRKFIITHPDELANHTSPDVFLQSNFLFIRAIADPGNRLLEIKMTFENDKELVYDRKQLCSSGASNRNPIQI